MVVGHFAVLVTWNHEDEGGIFLGCKAVEKTMDVIVMFPGYSTEYLYILRWLLVNSGQWQGQGQGEGQGVK